MLSRNQQKILDGAVADIEYQLSKLRELVEELSDEDDASSAKIEELEKAIDEAKAGA